MAEDVSWGTGSGDLLSSPNKPRRLRTCQKYLQDAIVRKSLHSTNQHRLHVCHGAECEARLISEPSSRMGMGRTAKHRLRRCWAVKGFARCPGTSESSGRGRQCVDAAGCVAARQQAVPADLRVERLEQVGL